MKYIKKATALSYDKKEDKAPKVVAKGQGSIASNIIDVAKQYNIPIKKDEDMVELLSQIELNKTIPENMYKAVAEIFSFIYNMTDDKRKTDEKKD